jgi:hypothetical protein
LLKRPWPCPLELALALMQSSHPSAPVGWARCTAPVIRASAVRWRLRFCAGICRPIRKRGRNSSGRPRRWPRCRTLKASCGRLVTLPESEYSKCYQTPEAQNEQISSGLRAVPFPRARLLGGRAGSTIQSRSVFVALAESVLSELNMEPDRGNPHWSALLVVGRIGNVLEIKAGEKPREEPGAVIRL